MTSVLQTGTFTTMNFSFSKPAIYQIEVLGELPPDLHEIFGNMDISTKTEEATRPITLLTGKISDQTALAGILSALYESHITLINLKILKDL